MKRNDLTIDNTVADRWWSEEIRWVRTLKNPALSSNHQHLLFGPIGR